MKKQKTNSQLRLTDGAALLSAGLFYLGFGLHPLPVLTWFILLPLLLVAPRVSVKRTVLLSLTAALLGQIGISVYFARTLQMPPALLGLLIIYIAVLMTGTVSLGRQFLVRRKPLLAVLATASIWVTGEYLLTLLAPHGSWWSLGYSQSSFLPLLQLVSITGIWGLSFLLSAVPAVIAALAAPGATRRSRTMIGILLLTIAIFVGVFGSLQLHHKNTSAPLRAAAAVAAEPSDELSVTDTAGKAVLIHFKTEMQRLARQQVRVVVFPEKSLQVDQAQLSLVAQPLLETARQYNITAIIGVMVKTEAYENQALVITPDKGQATYVKQHLIPGLESDFDQGNTLTFVPGSGNEQGVIICKDLDFQKFVRSYRQAGASVLFAPAWDFNNDGWLHSRLAITRGVENGMSLVRSGRDGQLTISDARGRILAEHAARENSVSSVVADIPGKSPATVYSKLGDWFAYVCVAITAACVVYLALKKKR